MLTGGRPCARQTWLRRPEREKPGRREVKHPGNPAMNHNRRSIKTAAYCSAATLALTLAAPLALAEPVRIDIAADQPLKDAINDFARQADQQVLVATDIVAGFTAPALSGVYEPKDALTLLIADTGLTVTESGNETFLIAQIDENSTQTTSTATPAAGPTGSGDPVSVEGTVRGAITDSNLKGARVEIVETGQTTASDDLGRFRFPAVAPGTYTLRISYLGRETIQETIDLTSGGDFSQAFAMGFPTSIGITSQVDVIGTRSARAQAINQERTAENSVTVVSSDLLGNSAGTTISESLRRTPGISFVQDFDTGDGTNIVVRGLSPDLNTVRFNGIELPEGSGEGRSASLSNILSASVESVTISQTLLPNQDSGGIGGLVEIETFSALDRPDRFAQFSAEARQRDDDFLDDAVYTGQVSGRFGDNKNIGLGASVEYRDRSLESVSGGTPVLFFGEYLPLDSAGGATFFDADDVPPGNPFPFFDTEGGANVYPGTFNSFRNQNDSEVWSFGLNAAIDWSHHSTLRFDYRRLEETNLLRSSNYNITSGSGYRRRPVIEFGGEELRALSDSSGLRPLINQSFDLSETELTTDLWSLRGETKSDRWSFNYAGGFADGSRDLIRNDSLFILTSSSAINWDPATALDPALIDPVEGIFLSPYAPLQPDNENVPLLQYTDVGFAAVNDQSAFTNLGGSVSQGSGSNERLTFEGSARYDFEHEYLKYVEVGVDFERSEAESNGASGQISATSFSSLEDFGVPFDAEVLEGIAPGTGLLSYSPQASGDLLNQLSTLEANGLIAIEDIVFTEDGAGDVRATETEYAPYFQVRFDIGKLELIGGGRYSVIEIEADDFVFTSFTDGRGVFDAAFAEATRQRNTESFTQRAFLPRMVAKYRFDENNIIRFGYSQAIARPQLNLISDRRTFNLNLGLTRFGLPGNLFVFRGNPDLESARTDSFDLSYERYNDQGGAYKVSLFYKDIENLTELNSVESSSVLDGVDLPDFTLSDNFPDGFDILQEAESGGLRVFTRIPQNNPDNGSIWGLQVSAEQQFTWLPGVWSGFGAFANYTYTDSDLTRGLFFTDAGETTEFRIDGIRFQNDPEHSGTIAGTYNANGIDAALLYTYQDRTQSGFRVNGLSEFIEPIDSLDFTFGYTFDFRGSKLQLNFDATDILRDPEDPASMTSAGDDTVYIRDRVYRGGREFRLGLTATF